MIIAVEISPPAMNWRTMLSAYRNPEHAAETSKQAARVTPSAGWMIAAVDGIGCSGVAVARISSSTSSGATPASASARRPAATARSAALFRW